MVMMVMAMMLADAHCY